MENPHPAQESLWDALRTFPGIFCFNSDAGGEGPGRETVYLFGSDGARRTRTGYADDPSATRPRWLS
jgi:outer membrane receptor for monomeric catechols